MELWRGRTRTGNGRETCRARILIIILRVVVVFLDFTVSVLDRGDYKKRYSIVWSVWSMLSVDCALWGVVTQVVGLWTLVV